MLKERVATAIVLLGGLLAALFLLTSPQFALLVAAIVWLASNEWAALAKVGKERGYAYASFNTLLFSVVVWGFRAVDPMRADVALIYAPAALFWLFFAPFWLFRGTFRASTPLTLLVGVLVVVPAGMSMVSVHSIGPHFLLMLLAFVWIADIAAFFVGRSVGKHKLAPRISPGKSWEGAGGALVATAIYAIICAMVLPQASSTVSGGLWGWCLGVAVLLWALSIVGDLFESLLKRQAGVKDSGTLLPGHGGVLDRIDSLTSTLPVAALLIFLIAGGR